MYHIGIAVYSWLFRLVALFHPKANKMVLGHKNTWKQLEQIIDRKRTWLWFHAASLGEFEQGRPVIELLRAKHPEYAILLTFYSPSGYDVRKDYKGADLVCYLPFDRKKNVKRFLKIVQPSKAFFIKYEFWPNYLSELNKHMIPTYLVSGIFRENQAFFKPYLASYRQLLSNFTHFFVQNKTSVDLLASIGYSSNVTLAGDTRYDRVLEIAESAKKLDIVEAFTTNKGSQKPLILIAGSTWLPDEIILIPYFNAHPEFKLIVAPHEINESHLIQLESLLKRPSVRYSQATVETVQEADCLVIDCFGLLSSIYRYGNIAYIGGGFGSGIHNTLEAAVYGIPVLFGPKYEKFEEAKSLLDCEGGYSLQSAFALNQVLDTLLDDDTLRITMGKNAGEMVKKGSGSTHVLIDYLFS